MIRFLYILALLLLVSGTGYTQSILDKKLPAVSEQSLPEFLISLEEANPVKVFFLEEWVESYRVGPSFNGYTLRQLLGEVLQGSEVSYDFLFDYALVFHKDPESAIAREAILNRAVVQRKIIEERIIGDKSRHHPGKTVILRGTVRDQDEGKALEGTTVTLNERDETTTDSFGRFRLSLMPGNYVLTIRRQQYDDKFIDLFIYESGEIDLTIQETPIMLEEVVVSDAMILDKAIGQMDVDMTQLKRAPVFLGEVDVIKQIQAQPGVTTVGEVASGFNVRGGSVDQNLVLYDDVPVFNTSHAFGFFSAFHPEAIKEASFYRGGIPAEYGGRVSSVLNIVSRQGNMRKWTGGGGIGIISSHASIGGPIKKDTTSIQLSVRSTYSNWMLKAVQSNYKNLSNTALQFYDGSMKAVHLFSERTKLTLSGYGSNDAFNLADDTTYHWSNLAGSLRLDHRISQKLFSGVSLSYGSYDFKISEPDRATAFDLAYSITYPSLKIDFQLDGEHNLTFGLHNTYYNFRPGILTPGPGSNLRRQQMNSEKSVESAIYLSDGYNLSEALFVEAGVRLSVFNRMGPSTVYVYDAGVPRELHSIRDSIAYESGEVSKSYVTVEPRLSLRYSLNENSSVKFGYHRMAQYMHLVTNTAAVMPTDIWQSSNAYFKPQIADQISFGVFHNFQEGMFETFVETYYKRVKNTLDFKDGAELILNRHLETGLIPTLGTAYGTEFSITKVRGRLVGSLNYTFSRSFRQANSPFTKEQVNNGERYPANHDQPHVLNFNWQYGISRRIHFSGTFVYHTGRPISMPSSVYRIDGIAVSDFAERNSHRIADYHRLDLAFVVEGNHKKKKPWSGHWIFSFYNVYARKNAYSVFFADNGTGRLRPYRLSVIGTMIPSVTYSFKF